MDPELFVGLAIWAVIYGVAYLHGKKDASRSNLRIRKLDRRPTSMDQVVKEPFGRRSNVGTAPPVEGPPPTSRDRPKEIEPGKISKGGLNNPPTTPRPVLSKPMRRVGWPEVPNR